MNVKVVIMCHNTPDTTEKMYRDLSQYFDVTVFDSGSDEDKKPKCPCDALLNLYWPGCWREAIRRYRDSDFLWVIGGDMSLLSNPQHYLYSFRSITPFNVGCWSPCISGKSREVMMAGRAEGRVWNVWHLEGQAIAMSRELMKGIDLSVLGSNKLGWGVDFWFCWNSWKAGMKNILDGRVLVHHPESCGYNYIEAQEEMVKFLSKLGGPNWGMEFRAHPFFEIFNNNIRELGF